MYDKCLDFEFFPIFDDFISTKFPITTFSSVEEDSLIKEKGPISLFSPIKESKITELITIELLPIDELDIVVFGPIIQFEAIFVFPIKYVEGYITAVSYTHLTLPTKRIV